MFDLRHNTSSWLKILSRLGFELKKFRNNLKRNILYYLTAVVLVTIALTVLKTCSFQSTPKHKKSKLEDIKTQVPKNLEFRHIEPDPRIENLTMIGEVYRSGVRGDRLRGILLRALRFQNITRKVEKKYGLPKNVLLAMVMQESMGVDLLPNSSDDGGLGLCHMQPLTATEFGLKTLDGCKDLRNFKHGKKLRKLIQQHKFNKKELIGYDDRFHPILNLDAAGRMLWFYKLGPQFRKTPIKTAIYRYAGYRNYKEYYKMVEYYRGMLNDSKVIDDVRKEFNKLNPKLRINGKKANFDTYIRTHQKQHRNYGLDQY